MKKLIENEVSSFQSFDQAYKISNHPIKRTFIAISDLNKIHRGKIGIAEIAQAANLSLQDTIVIIQEFIDQRLINGYIRGDLEDSMVSHAILILKQDYYYCQIDQMKHGMFNLHFQCKNCLRFICTDCYSKNQNNICPFCKGEFIPVPRIFKEDDVQKLTLNTTDMKISFNQYYKERKSRIDQKGLKETSMDIFNDLKGISNRINFSSIKERSQNYWSYRKKEYRITRNEKKVIDTITTVFEVEEIDNIPLKRISKVTNLEISLVYKILIRLISNQAINGFIEPAGTFNNIFDDVLVLGSDKYHCEMHDEEHIDPQPISSSHYQCGSCFRAICEPCANEMKVQGMNSCLFCNGNLIFFPSKE